MIVIILIIIAYGVYIASLINQHLTDWKNIWVLVVLVLVLMPVTS